ncbi:HTH-type transcriptional regulator YofA [Saliniradius amylolyticus]|uniref:HTH-type transcriptional regulator YofA n=1 Tax=Saliniradius amylolyticus TaxID=2183582 RepID=A0A2S2E1E8_9ALTE|nr:LysR substrate-binding domain-containing protein [Saliniradius amylolyticus]AWL11475.1 HTH-type transcriptional regulator YofA [Saliniradius amylolyticus]
MNPWLGISEFVAVAEKGSFTRAAPTLNLSVAQVSRNIAALENKLGIQLLFRSTRKVSLTEEGEIYLQHCQELVSQLEEANQQVGEYRAVPKGLLRVTAPVYFGENTLAPLLNQFLMDYPQVRLSLHMTNNKLDLIEHGFDLAIRLGPLSDSTYIARRLTQRTQYLVASPGYLDHHGVPRTIEQLKQHECLQGSQAYWRFLQNGQRVQFKPRGRIQCNSGLALCDAACRGLGIAQLPDYYVDHKLATGELVLVLDAYRQADEGVWALYPHNRQRSAKVKTLVDYLYQSI